MKNKPRKPNKLQQANPGSELQVVKCILIREDYLNRLHRLSNKNDLDDFDDIFDLIRIATLDTVEAIVEWRSKLPRKEGEEANTEIPYLWNSFNYLLKIPSDLDFLESNYFLRESYSFSFIRNPFVIPSPMEKCPLHSEDTSTNSERIHSNNHFPATVRSKPPNQISRVTTDSSLKNSMKMRAYTTPILNEGYFTKLNADSQTGSKTNTENPHSGRFVSCNNISDISRIRKAEKVLLKEEMIHGKYIQDDTGSMVPLWKGERDVFEYALKIDDLRPMEDSAKTLSTLAPFALESGSGHDPSSLCDVQTLENQSTFPFNNLDRLAEKQTTSQKQLKVGGLLYLVDKPPIDLGRRRPPPTEGYDTSIDYVIQRKKKENEDIRNSLQEYREKKDSSCFHDEIRRLEEQMNFNEEVIKKKENLLLLLKKKEKRIEDIRRAKLIEQKRRMFEQSPGQDFSKDDEVDDSLSIEDISAEQIQRIVRGRLARVHSHEYRLRCNLAAAIIQSGYRGQIGRKVAFRIVRQHRSATSIQRLVRGIIVRKHFIRFFRDFKLNRCAIMLQKIFRGCIGRQRANLCLKYKHLATQASNLVSIRELTRNHLSDLASAITNDIVHHDNLSNYIGVFDLFRIVCVMIASNFDPLQVTAYSFLGVQSNHVLDQHASWQNIVKILKRGNMLLYYMRLISLGPTQTLPYRLYFSDSAIRLFKDFQAYSSFDIRQLSKLGTCLSTVEKILLWTQNMFNMFELQFLMEHSFESHLPMPEYVAQTYRERRYLEIQMIIQKARFDTICKEDSLSIDRYDGGKCDKEMLDIRERINDYESSFQNKYQNLVDELKEKMNNLQEEFKIRSRSIREYEEDIALGLFLDPNELREMKYDLKEKYHEIRNISYKLVIAEKDHQNCITYLLTLSNQISDDIHNICAEIGKIEGKLQLLLEEKKSRIKTIRCDSSLSGFTDYIDKELIRIGEEIQVFKLRKSEEMKRLENSLETFERSLLEKYFRDKNRVEKSFSYPYFEVESVDEFEDEGTLALMELHNDSNRIDRCLLENNEKELQKCVVFLDKHIPSYYRDKIWKLILHDFDGHCFRVAIASELIIDPEALQNVLDSYTVIVSDVDVKMDFEGRQAFLQCVMTTKLGLLYDTKFICIYGNPIHGSIPYCDTYLTGSSSIYEQSKSNEHYPEDHMFNMNAEILRQTIASLKSQFFLEEISLLCEEENKPTTSILLILEATIIVSDPKSFILKDPIQILNILSWGDMKKLLQSNKKEIFQTLQSTDLYEISENLLEILQQYVNHPKWVQSVELEKRFRCLSVLRLLIEQIVSFGERLVPSGGKPAHLESSLLDVDTNNQLFDLVINMTNDVYGDEGEYYFNHLYKRILAFILSDACVHEFDMQYDGKDYIISLYNCLKSFYFVTTEGSICNRVRNTADVICVMKQNWDDIDYLLPTYDDKESNVGMSSSSSSNSSSMNNLFNKVPGTNDELFNLFERSISVEKQKVNGYDAQLYELRLSKPFENLVRDESMVIDGHHVNLNLSRSRKFDMVISLHLYKYENMIASSLSYDTIKQIMFGLYTNRGSGTSQFGDVGMKDINEIGRCMIDMLAVTPTSYTLSMGMMLKTGANRRRLQLDYLENYNKNLNKIKHNDHLKFSIQVKSKCGVGRTILKCFHKVNGVVFAVTVKEVSVTKELLIRAYDLKNHTMTNMCIVTVEDRLSAFEGNRSNMKDWKNTLLKNLHIVTTKGSGLSKDESITIYFKH